MVMVPLPNPFCCCSIHHCMTKKKNNIFQSSHFLSDSKHDSLVSQEVSPMRVGNSLSFYRHCHGLSSTFTNFELVHMLARLGETE